jgi:hypothetical protein
LKQLPSTNLQGTAEELKIVEQAIARNQKKRAKLDAEYLELQRLRDTIRRLISGKE